MHKEEVKPTYGLVTTIAMIVGIVIGSGIYFKADDILNDTGGNVWLGMLVLVMGSMSIIFGSLSISSLALQSTVNEGIFSYYEQYVHPALAATMGFFTAYLYLPTITAVVAWVAAMFTLGESAPFEVQIALAAIYIVLLALLNVYSRMFAGYFQSLTTMIKMLPLMLIAVIGLFWSGQSPVLPLGVQEIVPRDVGWGWISGLVPLYFAYDGWSIVTNIAPEIKSPHKNLPRALIVGPLIVLSFYLLFFYGLNRILGETFILSTGNGAIQYAMKYLFGDVIGQGIMLVIIMSVLGVVNGLLLANMRLPRALAERGWIRSDAMAKIDEKYQVSILSSLSAVGVCLLFLVLHYVVTTLQILPGSDISEITIVFNNTSLIVIYAVVLNLYRQKKITNRLTGLIAPILAIVGAIVLLVGSLMTNFVMTIVFFMFCLLFCVVAYLFYRKNQLR